MIQLWTICNFIDVWCIKFMVHQITFRLAVSPLCMHLSGFSCNHSSFYCHVFPSLMWSCKVDVHVMLQSEYFTWISAILESKEYVFQIWKWFLAFVRFLYNSKAVEVILLKWRISISVLKAKVKAEEQLTEKVEELAGIARRLRGSALRAPLWPWSLCNLLAALLVGRC